MSGLWVFDILVVCVCDQLAFCRCFGLNSHPFRVKIAPHVFVFVKAVQCFWKSGIGSLVSCKDWVNSMWGLFESCGIKCLVHIFSYRRLSGRALRESFDTSAHYFGFSNVICDCFWRRPITVSSRVVAEGVVSRLLAGVHNRSCTSTA